jgi:hypothetical protein
VVDFEQAPSYAAGLSLFRERESVVNIFVPRQEDISSQIGDELISLRSNQIHVSSWVIKEVTFAKVENQV